MTRTELLDVFRREVRDIARPYLWSDDEIEEFIDEAQNQFVRLTGGIADSTSTLCEISAPIGTEYVTLEEAILKIRFARRSDGTELKITNFEDHGRFGTEPELVTTSGTLSHLVLGVDAANIRLHNIPNIDETITLIIYRLPLNYDMTEISSFHHRSLVHWMKHLAYNKHDSETFNKVKASDYKGVFEQYCMMVTGEKDRKRHKPRSVVYGGI